MLQRAISDEEVIIRRINIMLDKLKKSTSMKVMVKVAEEIQELKKEYGEELVNKITKKYFKEIGEMK